MEYSDNKLIGGYLAGDERALELLIQRYLKPVYGFVYRYAGNAQDAEDITQEVFLRVWRNLKRFDGEKSFKTWIFSIAKNASLDFIKKKKTLAFSDFSARGGSAFGGENEDGSNSLIDTLRDFSPLPLQLSELSEIRRVLENAKEKLLPKYSMVLSLRYNDDLTFREIAESLGEPLHTVKSRNRRALAKLLKILS